MIEFQYFQTCPHAHQSLTTLNALVAEGVLEASDITVLEVNDVELAEEKRFLGSPTILVDGVDLYTLRPPQSFSFSCRLYEIAGRKTGELPKEFIREQIAAIRAGAISQEFMRS